MKSMFGVVIVLLATAVIFAVEPSVDFINTVLEASNACVNKTGITPIELMKFNMMQTPENNKPFCYIACTAKTLGLMTADNKINKEKINITISLFKDDLMKSNTYEKILKVVNICLTEVPDDGKNECDVAKAAYECTMSNGKKEGIFNLK